VLFDAVLHKLGATGSPKRELERAQCPEEYLFAYDELVSTLRTAEKYKHLIEPEDGSATASEDAFSTSPIVEMPCN